MSMIVFAPRFAVPVAALVFVALSTQSTGAPALWFLVVAAGLLTAGLGATALIAWRTADVVMTPVRGEAARRLAADDASDLVRLDSDAG